MQTEEPKRLAHRIICSCSTCAIDFTITTTNFTESEIMGTPDLPVYCPLCKIEAPPRRLLNVTCPECLEQMVYDRNDDVWYCPICGYSTW